MTDQSLAFNKGLKQLQTGKDGVLILTSYLIRLRSGSIVLLAD